MTCWWPAGTASNKGRWMMNHGIVGSRLRGSRMMQDESAQLHGIQTDGGTYVSGKANDQHWLDVEAAAVRKHTSVWLN
jgi:hypothetical protein